jgi:hypothetical protein
MEDVGIFIVHSVYYTAIWCTYVFMAMWYMYLLLIWCICIFRFGMLYQGKSGNPVTDSDVVTVGK